MGSTAIASLPAGPIDDPRWKTAIDAEASSDGSNGVVFVLTSQGGYVIKASSRPAEEYFASLILEAVSIRAPKVRVVSHAEPEYRRIKEAIRVGSRARRLRGDECGATRVEARLRGPLCRPQLLVMEVVTGSLPLEGHPRAAALLDFPRKEAPAESHNCGDSDDDCAVVDATADARGRLCALGRILAVDVFLNNSDRIGLGCWDNDGNGGNLLLQDRGEGGGEGAAPLLVPIDTVVTALRPKTSKSLLLRYVARAQTLLDMICRHDSDGGAGDDALGDVRQFVYNNTGHTLTDEALSGVRSGVRQCVTDIVHHLGKGKLLEHLALCAAAVAVDWEGVWSKSVACVDLAFLQTMLAMFEELTETHTDNLPPHPSPVYSAGTSDDCKSKHADAGPARLWAALPPVYREELRSFVAHPCTPTGPMAALATSVPTDEERKSRGEEAGGNSVPTPTREAMNNQALLMTEIRSRADAHGDAHGESVEESPATNDHIVSADGKGSGLRIRREGEIITDVATFRGPPPVLASVQSGVRNLRKTPHLGHDAANPSVRKQPPNSQQHTTTHWRTREKAESRSSADLFAQRHCCGASAMHLLPPNASLAGVLHLLNQKDKDVAGANGRRVKRGNGGPAVVALDFDQTITEPGRTTTACNKPGRQVRGGASSLRALGQLANRDDVELVIVTATKPSRQNASAIAEEVRCLGLARIFDVENDYPEKLRLHADRQRGEGAQLHALTARDLTVRLVSLLATAHGSDRVGADLWRIDFDSVTINAADGTASFCTRLQSSEQQQAILSTNKVRDPVDIVRWEDLNGLSKPQHLRRPADDSPDVVAALDEYCLRTKRFRSNSGSPLLLELSSDGMDFSPRGMPPSAIVSTLEQSCIAAGLTAHETGAIVEGESTVERAEGEAGGVVPLARCGRIICAGYNKPEALRWFVKSRSLRPRRVVFVDDNPSNVLSVFLDVGSRGVGDADHSPAARGDTTDGAGRTCWPTDAIWFEPPAHGRLESVDPSLLGLVRDIASRSVICTDVVSPPESVLGAGSNCAAVRSSVLALLVQHARPANATLGASIVERALDDAEAASRGGKVRLVVLPENFATEEISFRRGHELGDPAPQELQPYSNVSAARGVYLVCGTAREPADGMRQFTTCVVLGPDGVMVGAYRKRRVHDCATQCSGDRAFVFDAGVNIGRVGVLICSDAEDPTLIEELRRLRARVIVNPSNIPLRSAIDDERTSSLTTTAKDASHERWRMALSSMRRRFEWRCSPQGPDRGGGGALYLLRCDQPHPHGMGTSQAIGPITTETVSSMHTEALLVEIPFEGPPLASLLSSTPRSSYVRTHPEDNTGARMLVSHVRVGGNGVRGRTRVVALRFFYPRSIPDAKLIVLLERVAEGDGGDEKSGRSSRSVAVIDAGKLSVVEDEATIVARGSDPDVRAHVESLLAQPTADPCGASSLPTYDGASSPSLDGGWLDEHGNLLFRRSVDGAELQLLFRKSEDEPLYLRGTISSPTPIEALAIDHLGGGFATVAVSAGDGGGVSRGCGTVVKFWTFSHNAISAPLADFVG